MINTNMFVHIRVQKIMTKYYYVYTYKHHAQTARLILQLL